MVICAIKVYVKYTRFLVLWERLSISKLDGRSNLNHFDPHNAMKLFHDDNRINMRIDHHDIYALAYFFLSANPIDVNSSKSRIMNILRLHWLVIKKPHRIMHTQKISLSRILFLSSYNRQYGEIARIAVINPQGTYELRDGLKRDLFELDLRYDPPSLEIKFFHGYNCIRVI